MFNVPVVLKTVETKGFSGYLLPQVRAVFRKQEPIAAGIVQTAVRSVHNEAE